MDQHVLNNIEDEIDGAITYAKLLEYTIIETKTDSSVIYHLRKPGIQFQLNVLRNDSNNIILIWVRKIDQNLLVSSSAKNDDFSFPIKVLMMAL